MTFRRQLLSVLVAGYALAILIDVLVLGTLLQASQQSLRKQTAAEFLEFGVETVDFAANHFFERVAAELRNGNSLRDIDLERLAAPGELVVLTDREGVLLRQNLDEWRLSTILTREDLRTPWEEFPVTGRREFALDNYDDVRAASAPELPMRVVFRLFPEEGVAVGYGRLYYDILARQRYLLDESRRRTRDSFLIGAGVFFVMGVVVAAGSDRLLNRSVTKPITHLVEEVLAIGSDHGINRVTVQGPQEVSELAASINQMSHTLAGSIEESKEKTREVEESLEEKETLLREVHHRVKNNMQMTASLLRMQMDSVADKEVQAHFTDALSRITAMALVHELLYESSRVSLVDPRLYVEDLVGQLLSATGEERVIRRVEVTAPELGPSRILPLGLIINELVSNSVKYALVNCCPGELHIRLYEAAPGALRLEYSDTGPGLPPEIDPNRTESLGLSLIVNLAAQLGGEPEFSRGAPFRFGLSWPETDHGSLGRS